MFDAAISHEANVDAFPAVKIVQSIRHEALAAELVGRIAEYSVNLPDTLTCSSLKCFKVKCLNHC